jgi:carbon storage regulator
MLVLTREQGEEIEIGGGIRVRILDSRSGRVRLGIAAPRDVPIHRPEQMRGQRRDRGRVELVTSASIVLGATLLNH